MHAVNVLIVKKTKTGGTSNKTELRNYMLLAIHLKKRFTASDSINFSDSHTLMTLIEHHILIHSVHIETQRAFQVSIKLMSAGNTDVLPCFGRIKCRILILVTYAVDPILIRMCN